MTMQPRRQRYPVDYTQYRLVNENEIRNADPGAVRRYITKSYTEILMSETGRLTEDVIEDNSVNEPGIAGEYLPNLALVFRSALDGRWYLQDTDSEALRLADRRGIVNNRGPIGVNGRGLICIGGYVYGFSGLTPGALIYASSIPGGYSDTKPVLMLNGPQQAIAPIGYASEDGKKINVNPRPIVYQKRVSLTANATTTLTHHTDNYAPTRIVTAHLAVNATVTAATYALVNTDGELPLRSPTAAGLSQPFTLISAASVSALRVMARRVGNPSGTLTAAIYTAVNGLPGVLVATSTTTIQASSLGTVLAPVEFAFAVIALTPNMPYCIVIQTPDIVGLANYAAVGADTSSSDAALGYAARQSAVVWATIIPSTVIPFELLSNAGTRLSQGVLVGYPSNGIWWASGDTNGNNPDTMTTLTNKTGSALSDVVVSVMFP